MALTQFGGTPKTLFLNTESHKLHIAFTVAEGSTVKKGQPVVVNTDGEILPVADAATATTKESIIGYSIMNGAAGEEVTVMMRPFSVMFVHSAAAQNAGLASYAGVSANDANYMSYKADTAANANAIAIDKATAANEIIRVLLF